MSRETRLANVLGEFNRVAICGGPHTGKTTLSGLIKDRPVFHTDDLKSLPWADVPDALIERVQHLERFAIEGVQVPRALRRGMVIDAVIFLDEVMGTPNHSMAKAVNTVFRDWRRANPGVYVTSPDLFP